MIYTKKLRLAILFTALVLGACSKKAEQKDGPMQEVAPYSFSQLKKHGDTVVRIQSQAPKGSLKDYLDERKLNMGQYVRDSLWPNATGYSKFYTTEEVVVVPDNQGYVYPGSLLQGYSVSTPNYVPLPIRNYKRYPITARVTFPSDEAEGVIDTPSLSRTRIFLRKALLAPGFSGAQIEEFLYETFNFYYYDELKWAYGSNVNIKGLFSSSSISTDVSVIRTQFPTAIVAKFTTRNFTMVLDEPSNGKLVDESNVDLATLYGYSPVYVNTITYGRMGIIVIESNNMSEEVKLAYEKTIKKIFNRSTETLTEYEKTLVNTSKINVYLIGGSATPQAQAITGYDQFINYIAHSGGFSASDPGVPILFSMRYLSDNSPVKTTFQIDYPR
ncbi:thiol-activated cytolysin family protein [Chitinophaga sp. CC14]|uniref:thiol-activated cytolysin family protein n=1 Tax=Chitinophaga sp. CC14 TaxID=3029199 RepID=UPI003B81858D